MIYKLKSIRYSKSKRKIIFTFHTPIKKNFCGGKSYHIDLKYESATKAMILIHKMEEAFRDRYGIEFIYPDKKKVNEKKQI
jgi:hypothetical protein